MGQLYNAQWQEAHGGAPKLGGSGGIENLCFFNAFRGTFKTEIREINLIAASLQFRLLFGSERLPDPC